MTEPYKTIPEQFPVLRFFQHQHLPEPLRSIASSFSELAYYVVMQASEHPAEKAVALRKLLEAKDAAVRCALPASAQPIPKETP